MKDRVPTPRIMLCHCPKDRTRDLAQLIADFAKEKGELLEICPLSVTQAIAMAYVEVFRRTHGSVPAAAQTFGSAVGVFEIFPATLQAHVFSALNPEELAAAERGEGMQGMASLIMSHSIDLQGEPDFEGMERIDDLIKYVGAKARKAMAAKQENAA